MRVFKRFTALILTLAMILTLFAGLTITASAATTYTASEITSVSDLVDGGMYMIVQGNHAAINTISSSALQTTATYNTTGLTGSENYVWIFNGSGNTFTIKSAANSSFFIGNSGSNTTVTSTSTSWYITYASSMFKIQRANSSGRFLGYTNSTSYAYKAYATNNYTGTTYPHDIHLYKLTADAVTATLSSIAVSSSDHRSFTEGDEFVGESITGTYSDNSTAPVTSGLSYTGYDMNTVGTQTVTVTHSSGLSCSYDITVNAIPRHTVTFVDWPNDATDDVSVVHGNTVTRPTNPTAPDGYYFIGWSETDLTTASDTAPALYDFDTAVTADVELYAIYAVGSGGGGGSDTYTPVTSAPDDWSGNYVIVNSDMTYALSPTFRSGTSGEFLGTAVTVSNDTITNPDASIVWTFTKNAAETGYYIHNASGYLKITGTSSANAALTAAEDDFFTIESSTTSGVWKVVSGSKTARCFAYYATNTSFRTYAKSSNNTGYLFKATGSAVAYSGYTSNPTVAEQTYTVTVNQATGGTISASPNTSVAADSIVTLTAIPDTGYAFGSWTVTDASSNPVTVTGNTFSMPASNVTVTATFTQVQTYTLTYDANTTDTVTDLPAAVSGISAGTSYTLSMAGPARIGYFFMGWAAAANSDTEITSVTMNADTTVYAIWLAKVQHTASFYATENAAPTTTTLYEDELLAAPANPTAPTGFIFCGWTTEPYAGSDAPTYFTFGSVLTDNVSLYAVYTLAGAGGDTYSLVSSNDDLSAGDKYILVGGPYNTAYDAASSTLSSGFLGIVDISAPENETVTNSDSGLYVFTLGGTAAAWTLTNANGNVLSAASETTLGYDGTNTAWTISVTDGAATIINSQYPDARILYNATSPRFKTYTSDVTAGLQLPALYKQGSSGAADAGFTTDPILYTATWMNGDAVYQSDTLLPDEAIVAPAADPAKTGTDTQYYTFTGWSLTVDGALVTNFGTISDNVTYYAVYALNDKCVVTWKNYDAAVLETDYCMPGDMPAYDGDTPVKPATATEYYTFSGWDPTVSVVGNETSIIYTATFTTNTPRYEASLALSRTTVRVGRTITAMPTLTDCGVATTEYSPVYSFDPTGVATIDAATGVTTGVAAGATEVTVTYTVDGVNHTASQDLVVAESTSAGGYTLITQDNTPADWSGDYIIMGKVGGTTTYQNAWMILTPNYDMNTSGTGVGIAVNNEDAATISLTDDNGVGTGTIGDEGNASTENSSISRGIEMEDTGLVTDVNGNDIAVYDTITSIDSAYVFTIECIDDVNQIYTIRVKDTSLYIACSESQSTGSNSLNFSASATEYAQWKFSVDRVTRGGYNNDIIKAENVGNPTRRLYYNNNYNATTPGAPTGQFRDYHTNAFGNLVGGNSADGDGQCYSLYLFGNPNPFNAQIYHQGEQITITNAAEIPQGRTTPVELTSALVPDIANYPNWEISTPATWSLDTTSSAAFEIDAQTGELSIGNAAEGAYTLVKVNYVVHDLINNVYHNVSTLAKVTVIAGTATYSTVIYETASGSNTETQYTVYKTTNGVNTLPLSAYVVNDLTGATSKDAQNPVTMGGTLVWTLSQTGSGATINSATGAIDFSGVTADNILTVTATGATGNGTAATAATYKIYVKTISYTAEITHTNGTIGPATIPYGTSAALGNIVTNANDATVSNGETGTVYTVSYTNAIWAIVGAANGATIIKNANGAATLNVTDCAAGTVITVRLAGMTATTIPEAGETAITMTIPATEQEFTVGPEPTTSSAVEDVAVVDYALPMQIYVLDNDTYENLTITEMNLISAPATFTIAQNNVTGDEHYGDQYILYTPSGELYTSITFRYQVTLSNGSTETADVTVKPAGSVYYEQNYDEDAQGENGYFTFQDGKHGLWETVGTQSVFAQSNGIATEDSPYGSDIFEYDSNYRNCATYSGGSSKMTTVGRAIVDNSKTLAYPQVDFTFIGTGIDLMSVCSNNSGAFIISIYDAATNARVHFEVVNTYYGYNYSAEAVERTLYTRYDRYSKTIVDGVATYTKYTSGDITGFDYIASSDKTKYYYVAQFYTKDGVADATDFYVASTVSTHWLPTETDNALYQIPVIMIDDLPYGRYNVTINATYAAIFDIDKTEENYEFYFDAVRIHNPINEVTQFNYINVRDRLIDGAALGTGSATPCPHTTILDWAVTTVASNTNNGKGAMSKKCAACGYTMDKAYYYITAAAAPTTLDTGSGVNAPETAALTYNVTWDSALDEVLTDAVFTPSWRSGSANVITCNTASATATAQGPGSTYANLQLKIGDVTYASAIHTNNVTVTGSFIGTCAHSWVLTGTTPATCTAPAYDNYECSLCGSTKQEPVDGSTALGHDYIYTNNGDNHTVTCSRCDYSVTEAHTYTDGVCVCGANQPVNTYSVNYVVPAGATAPSTQTVTEGDSITVASTNAPAAYDAHTYTFVGWAVSTVAATATQPTLITAGTTYCPENNTTLYAVYTYSVTDGIGATDSFGMTDSLTDGDYVIGCLVGTAGTDNAIAAMNATVTSNWLKYATMTPESGVITNTDTTYVWTLTNLASGFTLQNKSTGEYLTLSGTGSGSVNVAAEAATIYASVADSTQSSFEVHQDSSATAASGNQLACNLASGYGYRVYAQRAHATSATGISTQLRFFKAGASNTAYFTTTLEAACEHQYTSEVTTPATCTTAGVTTYTCSICGHTYTEPLAALGHSYVAEVTTAATCTGAGLITYTCSRCGDSYTETIAALGHDFDYTDNGNGTHSATCGNGCGTVITNEAHTYLNGTCTYCGAIQPDNYAASINPHGTATDPYQIVVDSTPEIDLGLTNNGNAVSNYTVSFSSTDADVAEVIDDNGAYNILAYEIGTATITASFTVNSVVVATATTYVQVAEAVWTATFIVPAGVTTPAAQSGTSVTLPAPTGDPSNTAHEYTFVGWTDAAVGTASSLPEKIDAGYTATLTEDTTYYALYSYETAGGTDYTLADIADISSMDEVVITMTATSNGKTYALPNDGGAATPSATEVTVGNNVITSAVDSTLIWNIVNDNGTLTIYPNGSTASWLYCTNANTGVCVGTNSDNSAFTISGNYLLNTQTSRYVGVYVTNPDWRCYTSTTGNITDQTLGFYTKTSGGAAATYWTTLAPAVVVNYTASIAGSGTIAVGNTANLTATLYADGSQATIYTSVAWNSSDSTKISLSSNGATATASAVAAGSSTITATFTVEGQTVTATKVVTAGTSTGPTTAQDVDYLITSGKVANWGKRGNTAEFLTTYAQSYYTGSYTYATLAANAGASASGATNASTLLNSDLGQALHSMVAAKQTSTTSYEGTKSLYQYTDCEENDIAHLSSYYSGTQLSSTWDSAATWNREHTWPNSKGANGSDENDIMMLRPTSTNENGPRGNLAYGSGSGFYNPNAVSNNALNLHGDVARLMLQHFIRWGNTSYLWGASGVFESRAVMLQWLAEDPVDTWEMGRNDAVQSITGVRNVFVDYPELAFQLLGADVPADYVSPSCPSGVRSAAIVRSATQSDEPATRDGETNSFVGTVFIDGKGNIGEDALADLEKNGPKNEVYLNAGQCIVFYLTGLDTSTTTKDLQIGAKAVNGSAGLQVIALTGTGASGNTDCLTKTIATATEMYYEFGGGVTWSNGMSCAIVIRNSGSGILSLTKLRYSNTEDLEFYVNSDALTRASRVLSAISNGKDVFAPQYQDPRPTGGAATGEHAQLPDDIVERPEVPTLPENPNSNPQPTESEELKTPVEMNDPEDPQPPVGATGSEVPPPPVGPTGSEDPNPPATEPTESTEPTTEPTEPATKPTEPTTAPTEPATKPTEPTTEPTEPTTEPTEPATEPTEPTTEPTEPTTEPTEPTTEPTEPVKPVHTPDQYKDLNDSNKWYYKSVEWVLAKGYMNGMTDDTFVPNGTVTRAMMITVIYRIAGEPKVQATTKPFTDVELGKWYTEAIIWAVTNNISNGTSAKTFSPDAPITREQMVAMLWRYAGKPASKTSYSSFSDAAKVDSYAATAMSWAIEQGIIKGDNNALRPMAKATRAEIATILERSEKILAK